MELSNDAVLKIEQALSIPRLSKYENFYKDKGEPYEKSDVLMLYERWSHMFEQLKAYL